jgi:hypothetical protein
VDEDLIDRGEIVGLLLNVADVARSLARIEVLLGGDESEAEED